ncbi:LemA protein [Roseivirga pacifica]|uniref:LemA protein n=1 Tax=Roseivirga pacifica TaxID=1267423 RepID=A0A1I0MWA8_9BACT|nr:LemA family protein [Roseivirga pacifica]MCO6359239.1 LemA family protein [Roseivirga pacifica]MCO6365125.1 LemA family protein [Roseivirga pacifica]MCO6372145.1 LemA family protein [Roseivirga pacifica]MCO6375744.1 LemA family protein [Roseivirga pacifica]MCO6379523.1 LemA family protein [Roseivirga pacifica]
MKKKWIVLIVVALVVLIGYSTFKGTYNGLVQREESIDGAWAQVENQYQRRADLIPNLVNTVKGYADFEQETLTGVIEARAKATSVSIDPSNLTPQAIANFEQAQQGLSGALSRLMVTVERYPDLKANTQFQQLQVQLEGTENRISVERRNFNGIVQEYNTYIRTFPKNIYANVFGFEKKAYFEASAGADTAPEVSFD